MPPADDERSLGDEPSLAGAAGGDDPGPQSLGDQATFAGGAIDGDSHSLGDQSTMGGSGGTDHDLAFQDDMEIVDLAGRYTTEGVLGKGGMGEVLLATDTRLNRKVAIKRILGRAASSRTAVNRFLTEAQSIAALNHPNIVQIYDYGRAADGPFLIMEYVEGSSLLDRCREGALPLEDAVQLTCQLCDGLGKAHDANIIHRDIKPANVLLTADGLPKLTDFGLAKDEAADTGQTMAGAVLGTLDFMPPEQRRDAALTDARSDLWSLAATLYQMVTGKSPKIIRFNDVPQSLQDVLGKALEEDKDDRYRTAREFGEALRASLQEAGSAVLEEGDCPDCGTKNAANRKFCRNSDCGASLLAPCLSCDAAIPMWEEVCGECGSKQSDLLEERRTQLTDLQAQAEFLLQEYDFWRATEVTTQLQEECDVRLQHFRVWAEGFLQRIAEEQQTQEDHVATLLSEALQHEQSYDYKAGIHTLEQIPEALRSMTLSNVDETPSTVLQRLQSTREECQRLNTLIRERKVAKQFDGLLEEVDALLLLRPQREDLQKLKQVLSTRQQKLEALREKALRRAKQLLEQQDYAGCVQQLDLIEGTLRTPEVKRLQNESQERLDRVQSLRRSIDAGVESQQWQGLLEKVEEYLTLHSDDADMQQLEERLIVRAKKNAAQIGKIMGKAHELRAALRFEEACQALRRIPEQFMTDDAEGLLQNCSALAEERKHASESLGRAMEQENFQDGLTSSRSYQGLLEDALLEDTEFQTLYAECQQAQQASQAAAAYRRRLLFRLSLSGVAVAVAALVIGAGLWIRSSIEAKAIAERARSVADALAQRDYEAALALDVDNVQALIGRANVRLTAMDVEGALADLDRAESLNSSASGLKATRAAVYARRALAAVQAGDMTAAQRDYAVSRTLGASDTDLNRARKAIADSYVKQAQTALASKAIAEIRSACDKAERYGAGTVSLSPLRAKALHLEGQRRTERGMFSAALSSFEQAMELDPSMNLNSDRAQALYLAGQRQRELGDFSDALNSFEQATKLDPSMNLNSDRAQALHLEGQSYRKRGELPAALSLFERATKLDPSMNLNSERAVVHVQLGSQAMNANDVSGALSNYEAAVALGNSDTVLRDRLVTQLSTRCRDFLTTQNVASGVEAYSTVKRLDPQAGQKLASDLGKLPDKVLSQLSPDVLLQLPPEVWPEVKNSIGMQLKQLPGGTFLMGSESGYTDENPVHEVSLSQPFYMGVYEVTQEQYEQVMGTNPSYFKGPTKPVEQVSWAEAVDFCRLLSTLPQEQAAGRVYRLPTEAEWEYACRSVRRTVYSFGDEETQLDDYAWFGDNSGERTIDALKIGDRDKEDYVKRLLDNNCQTHPVGQKRPNPWGLYDMHGNVWEWCQDWYGFYPSRSVTNPVGPSSGSNRVCRGGGWWFNSWFCRSANRRGNSPAFREDYLGFRVVLSPPDAERAR